MNINIHIDINISIDIHIIVNIDFAIAYCPIGYSPLAIPYSLLRYWLLPTLVGVDVLELSYPTEAAHGALALTFDWQMPEDAEVADESKVPHEGSDSKGNIIE